MRQPTSFNALILAVALACGGLILWLWRQGTAPDHPAEPPPTRTADRTRPASDLPPSTPGTDALGGLSPEQRAMFKQLASDLARGRAREREAVLAFKDDDALQRFLDRAKRAGLPILGQLNSLRAVRVGLDSLSALQRDLLENTADYAGVAANGLIGIPQPPAKQDRAAINQVPFGNDTLAFLGATGDRSAWGRGTTIAILDTGIAGDATFGSGRVRTLDLGLGSSPGNGSDDGHGTAVAALAAGAASDAGGVAPAANLLSIRVTDTSGVSDLFTVSRAIVAATDAGASIINVSLGGYSTGPVLDAAITYATQRGALIVAAAGNDQAAQLAWPAADARVVSVGAIDKAEQQVSFSNSGDQLQLTAPGYGVQTAWLDGRRVYVDGTSASAPLVSGAIAAVMSQNSNLSARQAADLLVLTANDGGPPGVDAAYGHGIINLATALNRANPAYVDTAVSSHSYDPASGQMAFVIQNRSGRTISGMALEVSVGTTTSTQPLPGLAAGESYVTTVPVNESTLKSAGSLAFKTRLVNPIGTVDQVPANNSRSSVLSAPTR
ncbi:S8 family peptidase [Horticoccus sp. 23ND18S-11]|uniref:S8 family peptidase n=1 Tax=Horticoccus sp. 23ND18S-11 TaxID=3391832 RepID=UPI0039C8C099